MAKQTLSIGSSANDGTGDSLRDGAIKLNSVINELYAQLGNDTNLQINVTTPSTGQVLKWNGAQFVEGHVDALTADLDVAGFDISSSANGDVEIKPNGSGDIKFWTGGTGSALTYVDGADGKLKYSNHFDTTGDLPDNTVHHGMFAYVSGDTTARVATAGGWKKIIGEDHSLGDLGDVDMTVGGGPSDGQVIKWNATNSAWEPANDDSSGGGGGGTTQNLFEGITADTGTTTASAPTDVLTVAGGTNITTSITGDTLTIDMSGALGDANQNAYGVIGSDSGSKTASSATATINVIGGTSISTAVSGDNLTVTNDAPNIVQEVYKTVTGDSGTTTAQLSTSSLAISGGTGLASVVTSNTVTLNADFYLSGGAMEGDNVVYNGTSWDPIESPCLNLIVSATGNSAYRFAGSGVNTTTDNPTIYVYRGFTYRFNNQTGAAHPFALRTTSGGGSVTDGVSGSQEGVQLWTVPQSLAAGTTYVYQCTMHPAMVGNLTVV
tara:strand:+ start:2639 stop:4120 length:1482 start_codon:yes stop_codon:yes gene_type:complete